METAATALATTCPAWQGMDPCVPCTRGAGAGGGAPPETVVQRVQRRRPLYQEGDAFRFVHAVRSGTLKSSFLASHGQEQVSGFHVAGELLGLDGAAYGRHASSAVALEDSEVLAIPYAAFAAGGARRLHEILPRLLARELVRRQKLAALLATMSAEQRLASFLLNLSRRMQARGYSATRFHLRMTRADIGSYLGLGLETVSRNFSIFQQRGLLRVRGRDVQLLDRPALVGCLDAAAGR